METSGTYVLPLIGLTV